jgi:hypothetical protein
MKFRFPLVIKGLQTLRSIETVVVSTFFSLRLTLQSKESFGTGAILKVSIVLRPKVRVNGRVVIFNAQGTRSGILAFQVTVRNKTRIKFTLGTTLSIRTITRMRFVFKAVLAGASVGAKDFRVPALSRAFQLTILAKKGFAIVFGFGTIAKEFRRVHLVLKALNTGPPVITIVRSSIWTLDIGAGASKTCFTDGTVAKPTITVGFLEEFKGETIDISRLVTPVRFS